MGWDCEVGLTTDKELHHKSVMMHQPYLREFHRRFKFGMEDRKWKYKYRIRFMGVEKERI